MRDIVRVMTGFALVSALLEPVHEGALAQAGAKAGAESRVTIPDGYGLNLGTASSAMRYASDVYFSNGRVHARAGVASLGRQSGEVPRTTVLGEAPLTSGSWYAVNDGEGRTHVLQVLAVSDAAVTVTVTPAAENMQFPVRTAAAETPRPAPTTPSADTVRPAAAAEPAADRPRLPPLEGKTIALSVYHSVGRELTKYYLSKDGTFLRQYIGTAALGAVRRSERGDYAIQGTVLVLRIWQTATAATGGLPKDRYLAGGQDVTVETERHAFRLKSPDGAEIDGKAFKPITGGW
ncbi:MAG: hypothetical protein HY700_10815 [Gemmatimonadetes bacterium]|nr:hypothetical protein [Gemmatimonadota bacterium]